MLPDLLPHRATLTPRQLALVFGPTRWTFAELEVRAAQWAAFLLAQGVAPGDRVAILAHNHPDYVALIHALPRLGAVLVPLNWRLTASELHWQIEQVGAKWLVGDEAAERLGNAGNWGTVGTQFLALSSIISPSSPSFLSAPASQPPLIPLAALHALLFTSGTTGHPKAAQLTLGNHWSSAVGSALNLGLREDDRWLACLPLFHVGGLAIVLKGVIYGMGVVLHDGFDPTAVNAAIEQEKITHLSVVSVMLQRMLAAQGERPYPDHLRCVLLGGGPAPRPLLEDCARRGLPVIQTYGLTEAASQVTTLAPADALRKLGAAGKPLFGTEVRIEAPNTAGAGEIVVRGPTVFAGYWQNPAATQRVLREGWLHTGDVGYLDNEGFLYVLDRRDDLIISGGENVYPAEVEAALLAHPAVQEAGVSAAPDARWGQVPVAYVVLREPVPAEEIRAFCAGQLAKYKIPARFYGVGALPRSANGKLLRRELQNIPDPRPLP